MRYLFARGFSKRGVGMFLVSLPGFLIQPGCQNPPAASGIDISVPSQSSVAKVEATIRQKGASETTHVSFSQIADRWVASLDGLDGAANYEIAATGSDQRGQPVSSSNVVSTTLGQGRTAQMLIALQAPAMVQPGEGAPVVDTLWASAKKVDANELVVISVVAHSADPSSALSFAWRATCGRFVEKNAAHTTWLAPSADDACDLTVVIQDGHGHTASAGLPIQVGSGKGTGSATVAIYFNAAPKVTAMTASPATIESGTTVQLQTAAKDPDGDSLAYQWTSTCPGMFDNASQAATGFLPAVASGTSTCSFSVQVGDGRGGVGMGTLVVSAVKPVIHTPPVMGITYQSPDSPAPGQAVFFHAQASDPQGQSLTWSWSASSGSFKDQADKNDSSEIFWTAPGAADVPCTITVTATDALGDSASYVFTVWT
jgi:hypothetical protein